LREISPSPFKTNFKKFCQNSNGYFHQNRMLPELTVVGGSLVKLVGDKALEKVLESALGHVFQCHILPYATSPEVKSKFVQLILVLVDRFPGSLQEKAAIRLIQAFEHLESLGIPVEIPETKIVVSILDKALLEEELTLNQRWKKMLSVAFSGHSLDPGFPGTLDNLTPADVAILDVLDQPRWRQFSADSLASFLGVSCPLVKCSLAKFQSLALCERSVEIYDTKAVPHAGPLFRPMQPPSPIPVSRSQYQIRELLSLSEYGRDFLTAIRGPQHSADPEADRR
jgi:hypothetical protein